MTDDPSSQSALAVQVGVGSLGAALVVAGLLTLAFRVPEIDAQATEDTAIPRRPGLLHGLTAGAHRPMMGTNHVQQSLTAAPRQE